MAAVGVGNGVGEPQKERCEAAPDAFGIALEEVLHCLPGNELHGDEIAVEPGFEVVNRDDSRMVESCRCLRLLAQSGRLFARGRAEDFDCDVAFEACVTRLVHNAHSAATEFG